MPHVTDQLNVALADRYVIERELGQGGMATVYLARDLKHDRKVALKVLRPELAAVIGAERFLAEIKTTANLQHPHILPLHDSGEAGGSVFYVMPYVEGESLRDRITREKQLPVEDAVRLAQEIASALDYAHRHGVIHRDIKPENILLHDGQALVADFGIALAVSSAGGTRMTETGMSLGTPHYMSPEQAMGDRELNARSDVYALGATLYEMLVGEPPFTGPTAQAIVARVMTEAPRPLRIQRHTIPEHVEAAIAKALEKLPADRFGTAAEFAEALKVGGPAERRTGGRDWDRPPSDGPTVRRSAVTAAIAATVLFAALAAWGWLRHPAAAASGDIVRAILELPQGTSLSYPSIALSRDGSRIVVSANQGGKSILLQRSLDQLDFTVVPGSEDGVRPFLSPDGKWVGFAAGKTMRKVPLEGGPAADVAATNWAGGDWTDDGTIVYTPDYKSGLWRVPAGGGTPEQLTTPDSAQRELAHWWPQVLPDGEHVLFTAFRTPLERSQIEVLSLKTGERTVLLEGGVSGRYVTAGYLLYAKQEALFAVPFDLHRLEVTGQPVPVIQDVALEAEDGRAGFAVSDDGTLAYIAASTFAPDLELVWVTRQGHASASIIPPGRFDNPALSPDGRRVALAIARPGEAKDVWVLDLARGTRTPLTSGGANDFNPLFTPDGQRVIFESEQPVFDLYARASDGSGAVAPLLTTPYDKMPASFAEHGRVMLFEHHLLPHNQIWTLPMDSAVAATSLLASETGDLGLPRVSPNERWLAYTSNESSRREVYLSPYPDPTRARSQVSTDGGNEPRWTRGGRELVYRNGERMMSVSVDPTSGKLGAPVELFHGDYVSTDYDQAYDVTPDGERFLMLHRPPGTEPRQVIVVTNWFKELERLVPK